MVVSFVFFVRSVRCFLSCVVWLLVRVVFNSVLSCFFLCVCAYFLSCLVCAFVCLVLSCLSACPLVFCVLC